MLIELMGNFYNNHSLSIVNRNLAINLSKVYKNIRIIALDTYDPKYKLSKEVVKQLKSLETTHASEIPAIQVRHTYPPIWTWPENKTTKVVFIQPWEFTKVPFEWQYKFETFADALIVPSNFCKSVFLKGGINPDKIFTVPNGYDELIFNQEPGNSVEHLGIKTSNFNFVYVGNAQWRKGLDILLNAWSKSFKNYDKAKLIIKDSPGIYGHNNVLNEIVKLQYKTDCAEIIYLDNELSDVNMSDIFKASKVVVHPYRAEGFGMHIQEAMACGCLPIVTGVGPTDDFIPKDVGLRLSLRAKAINIADSNIFAIKPGDATTLMGSHTFVNEPIEDALIKAMSFIYHSHDRSKYFESVKNVNTLTTWASAAEKLLTVLNDLTLQPIARYN
jgi:glycosyltransferase involved in cell wall biosynthesis